MAVTDFDKIKALSVVNVTNTPTINRAVPLKIISGDDSITGTGDIVLDWTNISTPADIAIYDENDNLLNYYFESFDAISQTAVIWVYKSWIQDGTVQLKIAYGNGSSDQSINSRYIFDNETDLAAGYLFNETGENDPLRDVTSNNNNGTVNGHPDRGVVGIVDGAYSFDGTDDYINWGTNFVGCGNRSLFCWVKFRDLDQAPCIELNDEIEEYEWIGALHGKLKLATDGRTQPSGSELSTDTWYHIGYVWNGSFYTVYLNGQEDYTVTPDGTSWMNGLDSTLIGAAFRYSLHSNSVIDTAMFYSSCLSLVEITAIFNATKESPTFFNQEAVNVAPSVFLSGYISSQTNTSDSLLILRSPTLDQIRAIDPFSSYNSDTVNKLTRMKTHSEDSLETIKGCDVIFDSTSHTTVVVTPGVVYKDDVRIHITQPYSVDFTDLSNYYLAGAGFNELGWYYIVLRYEYQNQNPAPEAEILILKPSQRSIYSSASNLIFLKAVHATTGTSPSLYLDDLSSYDPEYVQHKRKFIKTYIGNEVSLPEFNINTDLSRITYVEEDDLVYFGYSNGWDILRPPPVPCKTKLILTSRFVIEDDEGVIVPKRFEVSAGGELIIEDNGIFMIADNN